MRRLLWLCAVVLLASCAPAAATPTAVPLPPTAVATATPLPPTPDPVLSGIQATMNAYGNARSARNLDGLLRLVTVKNTEFRESAERRLRPAVAATTAGTVFTYTVRAVSPRPLDYVRAEIVYADSEDPAPLIGYYNFRLEDGAWVLAEPTSKELRTLRRVIETPHFTIETATWFDDVSPTIATLAEEAATKVHTALGVTPKERTLISLVRRDQIGQSSFETSGYYIARTKSLKLLMPTTFGYGFSNINETWKQELRETIAHEYVHGLEDQYFVPLIKTPVWMKEGLAEYVATEAGSDKKLLHDILQANLFLPLDSSDEQNISLTIDWKEKTWIAYKQSQSLVTYLIEQHGGIETYWKLARAYGAANFDLDRALRETLDMGTDQFVAAWREWLAHTYLQA